MLLNLRSMFFCFWCSQQSAKNTDFLVAPSWSGNPTETHRFLFGGYPEQVEPNNCGRKEADSGEGG